MGMDEYIAKPLKLDALLYLIDKVILTLHGNSSYY
jgi:DNA-binding response OmpR family regulator